MADLTLDSLFAQMTLDELNNVIDKLQVEIDSINAGLVVTPNNAQLKSRLKARTWDRTRVNTAISNRALD